MVYKNGKYYKEIHIDSAVSHVKVISYSIPKQDYVFQKNVNNWMTLDGERVLFKQCTCSLSQLIDYLNIEIFGHSIHYVKTGLHAKKQEYTLNSDIIVANDTDEWHLFELDSDIYKIFNYCDGEKLYHGWFKVLGPGDFMTFQNVDLSIETDVLIRSSFVQSVANHQQFESRNLDDILEVI